jgi:aspartyl-tRNA(Asn)/glutamyl-tRNA(Gln) amidotransferase subunit A
VGQGTGKLHEFTLTDLSRALRDGELSSREITESLLRRIDEHQEQLNAFITVTADLALQRADEADEARASGDESLLNGLPIVHKDLFCTEGVLTTCGSHILGNFVSPYDATVVERLNAAGAVMLGKTNMDEFAMGSSNETSYFGPVTNPWNMDLSPGGSSGGSAAAVAARIVPAGTGTDTGVRPSPAPSA